MEHEILERSLSVRVDRTGHIYKASRSLLTLARQTDIAIKNRQNHSRSIHRSQKASILLSLIMVTSLDPKKTALLLLDLQNGFLQRLPPDSSASVLDHAASAILVARKHGVHVAYIRAALDETEVDAIPDRKSLFLQTPSPSQSPVTIPSQNPSPFNHILIHNFGI